MHFIHVFYLFFVKWMLWPVCPFLLAILIKTITSGRFIYRFLPSFTGFAVYEKVEVLDPYNQSFC